MRTRERSGLSAYSGINEWWLDGVYQYTINWSFPYYSSYSKIDDEPGNMKFLFADGSSMPAFKPVTHRTLERCSFSSEVVELPSGNQNQNKAVISLGVLPYYFVCAPQGQEKSLITADGWFWPNNQWWLSPYDGHQSRWDRVRPNMSSRANLALSLWELADVKRMFEIIPKVHFKLKSWKDVLRYANGLHLNYQFGWKPFVRDLQNIFYGVYYFEKRFNKLIAEQSRRLKRGSGNSREPDAVSEVTDWLDTIESHVKYRWRYDGQRTQSSTFDYYYSLPDMGLGELQLRAWLDTLGLNVTPSTIWDALPLSFIVGWFTDLDGYFRTFSSDWVEPWIENYQSCCSTRVEIEGAIDIQWCPDVASPIVFNDAAHFHTIQYARRTGNPQWTPDYNLDADKIRLLVSIGVGRTGPTKSRLPWYFYKRIGE